MRWLWIVLALVLLAACAPVQVRGDQQMQTAQAAREKLLAGHDHWTLHAHLGVSDGHHGGSGTLIWVQNGPNFTFTVRAPLTGRSFRLLGGPHGAVLEGLDQGTLRAADARTLLAQALGWQVPVRQLHDWVRGLGATGTDSAAVLRYGSNGLPSLLKQDGWTVQYRDWFTDISPALPRRVFAAHGDYHVRLSIQSWTLQ